VPMVVVYRVSLLTELVFRLLVRARFVSLPNIIAGREIVPELLQRALSVESLATRARPLLRDTPERRAMVDALSQVRNALGTTGASARVAAAVLQPRELPPTSI
jgi:lipid-A-disaccharide synthase